MIDAIVRWPFGAENAGLNGIVAGALLYLLVWLAVSLTS